MDANLASSLNNAPENQHPITVLKGRGFKMACLNINSLTKHIDELRIALSNQCVDILAINKTKLDGSISDNEVTVEGYNIICRDRLVNGRFGGGICFYIKSNINFILREDLEIKPLEILIEVRKLSSKPFVISTCYRPPTYLWIFFLILIHF